jgi:hypothetical protein
MSYIAKLPSVDVSVLRAEFVVFAAVGASATAGHGGRFVQSHLHLIRLFRFSFFTLSS